MNDDKIYLINLFLFVVKQFALELGFGIFVSIKCILSTQLNLVSVYLETLICFNILSTVVMAITNFHIIYVA